MEHLNRESRYKRKYFRVSSCCKHNTDNRSSVCNKWCSNIYYSMMVTLAVVIGVSEVLELLKDYDMVEFELKYNGLNVSEKQ